MKKKILITGSNGQMGNEFRVLSSNSPEYDFIFTDIEELDITDPGALSLFLSENRPDILINCAAYTAVDKAEQEPEKAHLINTVAPRNLVFACNAAGCLLIHISTDYIFDGHSFRPYTEEDTPSPSGVYATTKYHGEHEVIENASNALIFRTSWLYSSFGNNFVKTIMKYAAERGKLNVVFDQVGTPTYAHDLSSAILQIIPQLQDHSGVDIFHYSNEGVTCWYDFAIEITRIASIACEITPIETREYPTPAPRPFYSVLNKAKIKNRFGITIPYWKVSLEECIGIIKSKQN
jgi:dTDP-4-dehydrorhamnose reductase